MKYFRRLAGKPELYILLFFLCLVLLSWPFLSVVLDKNGATIFGYLFAIWALVILSLFLMRRGAEERTLPGQDVERGDDKDV